VLWRRADPDPPLEREDVIAIIDALTEIKAWTYEIWAVVVEEEQGDEDEP
jgi:hypothetical protein